MPKDEICKLLTNFTNYQIEWLKSHDDVRFEPIIETLIAQMIIDTRNCYLMTEIKESDGYEET
jgi:hypothetical protein